METEKIRLQTIYITYQGEINKWGIGTPVIFLRLNGCPIRCYKKTIGVLCDTPEALESDLDTLVGVKYIIKKLNEIRAKTGIKYVCLTGGDPLWQHKDALHELFMELRVNDFDISVETSGVISVQPYLIYHNVHWIVDYKLRSAGVSKFSEENFDVPNDAIIKFVIYDQEDFAEAVEVIMSDRFRSGVRFAFGLYWGTENITYQGMVNQLIEKDIFGEEILINFQAHKLAEFYDDNPGEAKSTSIRIEI